MIHFIKVHSKQEIIDVSTLAQEIWQEHYLRIVGQDQIDYMLEKFQSVQAIKTQLSDGYEYYSVFSDAQSIGYMALLQNHNDTSLMISKIYVKKSRRGSGLGKQMLQFVERLCKKRKIRQIWLTVNKHNTHSIEWYLRMGFTNKEAIVQDIGAGFVMDDFLMEKFI
jgi:ribosomal protein S18 acetylase RimI-like enzyme